jgi:hypothetical protein
MFIILCFNAVIHHIRHQTLLQWFRATNEIRSQAFYSVRVDFLLLGAYIKERVSIFFMRRDNIHPSQTWVIHIPVWGEYVNIYLSFLNRNLLSKSNSLFSKKNNVTILFSCFPEDKEMIEQDKNFKEIVKFYSVRFHLMPKSVLSLSPKTLHPSAAKYFLLGFTQSYALQYAKKLQSSLLPMHPDFLIEKDFLVKINNIAKQGHKVILSSPFRSDLEKFQEYIAEKGKGNSSLSFTGQEVVDLQCKFIHEISLNRMVAESKKSMVLTDQVLFREESSIVVKAFSWAPIFIANDYVNRWGCKLFNTIDLDLTFLIKRDMKKIYFLENANDLGICELSGEKPSECISDRLGRSLEVFLYQCFRNKSLHHLFFFNNKLSYTPSFELDLAFSSTDVDSLNAKFLEFFNYKGDIK